MGQTFEPQHRYAKAFGTNMKISAKNASVVCRAIKNKPLNRARRLLVDLDAGTRSLEGKYYSNATHAMLLLLDSCVKNAEFKGLDIERLFVHASATHGTNIQRRRRKGAFGSGMKTTNMEILLIERGKAKKTRDVKKEKPAEEKKPVHHAEHKEHKHESKEKTHQEHTEHEHEIHEHTEHKHHVQKEESQ